MNYRCFKQCIETHPFQILLEFQLSTGTNDLFEIKAPGQPPISSIFRDIMFIIPSHGLLYLCYIYKPPFTLAISTINHILWQCSFSHLINHCTAFAICRCKKAQVLHRRVGARQEWAGTPGGVRGKPVDG